MRPLEYLTITSFPIGFTLPSTSGHSALLCGIGPTVHSTSTYGMPFVNRTTAVVHAEAAIVRVVIRGPSETLSDGFTLGLTEKTLDEFGRNMYAPLFCASHTYESFG